MRILYSNKMKKWKFDKEVPSIFRLARISLKPCRKIGQTFWSDCPQIFEGKVCKAFREIFVGEDGRTDALSFPGVCEKCGLGRAAVFIDTERGVNGKSVGKPMQSKTNSSFCLSILFLLLLLLAGCQKKAEVQKPIFQVTITKPLMQTVNLYNTYIGNVQPFLQVEVKAQVEGVLTGAYFKEGDEVKEGDLIFSIDSRPYVAQLQKAEGGLAQSLANLRYAEDVAKRNARLAQEDYVSQVQYDEYITEVLTYKAAIKENEADISTAKINISYCNIHAPMNAVTGKIGLQVGNLIPNVGETPLVTLNQITPTYTYFSVPQMDLPQIMQLYRQKKLQVRAFLNGDYENPYSGTLDLIDNEVNTQTGSILMRGIFQNEDKKLWPGEFVDVHLILGEEKNAILIPTEAISQGLKGPYVFIIKEDNTAELKWIKIGQRIGNMTIVHKGVDPDDQVVLQGQVNLGSGTKVKIKKIEKEAI